MITTTTLQHPTTLNNIASVLVVCSEGQSIIIRNRKGEAFMMASKSNGVVKFQCFRTLKIVSSTVKKAFKSVDSVRFNALSFLLA